MSRRARCRARSHRRGAFDAPFVDRGGEDGVGDAVALEVGDEMRDERFVEDRDERFGDRVGEWAEPRATAADQDDRVHHPASTSGCLRFIPAPVSPDPGGIYRSVHPEPGMSTPGHDERRRGV